MKIYEIFKSCQGEGPRVFEPTTFVRFAGCNLAIAGKPCKWCDTKKAWLPKAGTYSTRQVVKLVEETAGDSALVCITGGEPLYHLPDLQELVESLKFHGFFVEVFTNGTLIPPLELFHQVDSWIVDIKCPSSGVAHMCRVADWLKLARPQDMVKFVVDNEEDLKYVSLALTDCQLQAPVAISPCIIVDLLDQPSSLTRDWMQRVWQFCCEFDLKYGLQVHKVVFGNKEGV